MKQTINNLLEMTQFEYEMMLFGMWSRWVESVTMTEYEYQKVLCNPAVNKWYVGELKKLESAFLSIAIKYPGAGKDIYRERYNEHTFPIMNHRPMPLIKAAIKPEDKEGYGALHGIKVQSLIFNKN